MSSRIESEDELRHWLAEEDWYMSGHTREWLERTPPGEAADLLARIAEDADPEPPLSVRSALLASFNIFSISGQIGTKDARRRRAGIRAALMLANLNDARCVPPLVRVFAADGQRQSKYQELIEQALIRFLSGTAGRPEAGQYAPQIRDLAGRAWQCGSRGRDLSQVLADLLVAALRCLHGLGGEPNRALLQGIAQARVTKPNCVRVQEIAQALLGS